LDDFGRAVSRILSSRRSEEHRGENHLSQQPVPGTRSAVAEHGAGSSGVPYLALHLMGFSVPRRFRARAVGSYSTFSPLLRRFLSDAAGRSDFLWHFPLGNLAISPPACISGLTRSYAASRPLVFGLSSLPEKLRESDSPPFQNRHEYTPCKAITQSATGIAVTIQFTTDEP
jgi:hypothetical protein